MNETYTKIDYFTVFKSLPTPNKIENLANWTGEVVSVILMLGH